LKAFWITDYIISKPQMNEYRIGEAIEALNSSDFNTFLSKIDSDWRDYAKTGKMSGKSLHIKADEKTTVFSRTLQ
jgi:hypothetical protein